VLRQYGLICAMTPSHSLFDGLNRKENHPKCVRQIREAIDATAEAGFPNVVVLSGFRGDLPEEVGLENCVVGLKQVISYAEKRRVNLCLEMINSRVDAHMKGRPDFMCDTVEWAVAVCDRIGSDRMKILFDIYHVQVMQGDLISRITQYKDYVAHYHTGGVPGRNEIDETQEINYPAVIRAIAETGYEGYIGHEFIPVGDPASSLRNAVRICDV
jgi:hydroxypyruvate isomerase